MTPSALAARPRTPLAAYTDHRTHARREIVAVSATGGRLLLDRLAGSGGDARLVGRIHDDEPPGNLQLLCRLYLADSSRGRCRPVCVDDLSPCGEQEYPVGVAWDSPVSVGETWAWIVVVRDGCRRALRWTIDGKSVHLCEVVGTLQDYEPLVTLTRAALAAHRADRTVARCGLKMELARLLESPIVLNRGLREHLQRIVNEAGVSLSEIATRCGRIKRTRTGVESGDTSWLSRRVGLLANPGDSAPTPWVHTDTLALIARDGLGIAPREVEIPVGEHLPWFEGSIPTAA
jgi:hypothetical protein